MSKEEVVRRYKCSNFLFLFYLGFLSRTFTIHRTAGGAGGYLFNSSLPHPPTSRTLRHQPGDYCRELISAHSQQPDSNRELLVSERQSLTTKLRALNQPKYPIQAARHLCSVFLQKNGSLVEWKYRRIEAQDCHGDMLRKQYGPEMALLQHQFCQ